MHLYELLKPLNEIAPLDGAEPWDNVGLLVGDPSQLITQILLTIDYTQAVADEARNLNCDLIIAYHPPIFSGVKRVTTDGPMALIHEAIRRGVAIYSPHTAWDAADGGTNDFLADTLGLIDVKPLRLATPAAQYFKLVTFVPESHVDAVGNAVFSAGAGHIGNYSSCSFRTPGTGTFFGKAGTNPTVGKAGQLEKQPEIRLETIIPIGKANTIIEALLKAHPYEEPAYDLSPLAAPPIAHGHGRVGNLPVPLAMETFTNTLKLLLNLRRVLLAGEGDRFIRRIAICAGAGGDLLDAAIECKADLYLTGELRHHDAIKATRAGMNVICTLHSNCERPSLMRLKARLEQLLPDCPPMALSQMDRDPFAVC